MLVETGNIVDMRNKLGMMTSVLASLKYDALGIGENDRRICGQSLYEEAAKNSLTVLDASPDAPKTAAPYAIKVVNGVRVGIFSFSVHDPSTPGGSDFEARKATYAAYRAAREGSDILVVLDQANVANKDWLERNGARLGAPDIVIGGMSHLGLMKEEVVGKTHIMPISMQGKYVGVVDVQIEDGKEPVYASQLVSLDEKINPDPDVDKLVKDFMLKQYNTPVQPAQPVTTVTHISADPNSPDKPYYSSLSCRTCHQREYDSWQATKHAHALKTLVDQQRAVPECLPCHSEMFRRQQRIEMANPGLPSGVECASCHMQALPHGMERQNTTAKTRVDVATCQVCHTKDRSPTFEEKSYFAKVVHQVSGPPKPVSAAKPGSPAPPTLVPAPSH